MRCRGTFFEITPALLAVPILVGCGGAVSDDARSRAHGDAAAAGAGGARGAGATSGETNAGAGSTQSSDGSTLDGGSGLVACNDGTGRMDCCPPSAEGGQPCDGSLPSCATPCSPDGWTGSALSCFDGKWIGTLGLFPCSGLVACNDGTGSADCCSESALEGRMCIESVARCSPGGCRHGFKSYLDCAEQSWSAEPGLFPCGGDAGPSESGDSGSSVSCERAGGVCLGGGSRCSTPMPSGECNPTHDRFGGFCCLDPPVPCTDGGAYVIQAENYYQSCSTSSDCVAVGEGNACDPCGTSCPNAAINVKAKPRYDADVAKASAERLPDASSCACPAAFGPCCVNGTCRNDLVCSAPSL